MKGNFVTVVLNSQKHMHIFVYNVCICLYNVYTVRYALKR